MLKPLLSVDGTQSNDWAGTETLLKHDLFDFGHLSFEFFPIHVDIGERRRVFAWKAGLFVPLNHPLDGRQDLGAIFAFEADFLDVGELES